jgi:hypothetical protein
MKPIFLKLLLALALAARLTAQETIIRQVFDTATDTHVEVLALFSKASQGGFLPVRVKLANHLPSERSIELSFDSKSNYSQGTRNTSAYRISAAAGKTVTQDILVPLSPSSNGAAYGASVSVKLNGSLGAGEGTLETIKDPTKPQVLLSEALFTPNASSFDSAMSSASTYGSRSEFAAKFDPKQLPDSWLAFSGYDSVLMTDLDWTSMPPSSRHAVLDWVRMGGQLAVFTTNGADPKSLKIPSDVSYGSVIYKSVSSDLKLDPKETLDLVDSKNPNPPQATSNTTNFLAGWPLQAHFGAKPFRYTLFIIVLVLFAILVGPINLFIFAKSGQRHRLFITTPLISLGASLLLIILIIAQDGFGGSGMRRVLMEVRPDGDENAAFVHQEQFCRTGVLTSSRFTLADPCQFSPVVISANRWARFSDASGGNSNQGVFNIQPVGSKLTAIGDWFQSRSEHGHILNAVVSTRGRIERTKTADQLLSTFDFPLKTLYYHAEDGKWFRAAAITTGKPFSLTAVELSKIDPEIAAEIAAFSPRNQEILKRIYQRPGCFIAITADAPGIASHPGIRWQETQTLITGPVIAP